MQTSSDRHRRFRYSYANCRLLSLHEVTPCLSDIFKRLQEETLRLVGSDAKAVLHVGVGRGFGEAALLFSAPDDPQIHYAENFSSLTDTLSAEWREYKSPDGDLGWSGFVLVIDKGGTQVRFSTAPYPSLGAYETAMQLEAEFFPNKVAAGRTSMPEAKR